MGQKALEILKRILESGYEAFVVGGALRKHFLGTSLHDYDIVTSCPNEDIPFLFPEKKATLAGKTFPVWIVDGVEVSAYRRPEKSCIDFSIEEDLGKRDLTINAMAWDPLTNRIIDPYGGRKDIAKKIIRFTGKAEDRIREDPLRIIRACRFAAEIEGEFAEETAKVLVQYANTMIPAIPGERIRLEIIKAMATPLPGLFFTHLAGIQGLAHIFPSMNTCIGHEGGIHHNETIFEHLMACGDALPGVRPLLRLTGYLHDVGKPPSMQYRESAEKGRYPVFVGHEKKGAEIVKQELAALSFSAKEIRYISGLIRNHMRLMDMEPTKKSIRKALYSFLQDGVDWRDWLFLRISDRKANAAKENYDMGKIRCLARNIRNELHPENMAPAILQKHLAINGKDVIEALSLDPGPVVGRILRTLHNAVLENPSLNTREKLLEMARGFSDPDA